MAGGALVAGDSGGNPLRTGFTVLANGRYSQGLHPRHFLVFPLGFRIRSPRRLEQAFPECPRDHQASFDRASGERVSAYCRLVQHLCHFSSGRIPRFRLLCVIRSNHLARDDRLPRTASPQSQVKRSNVADTNSESSWASPSTPSVLSSFGKSRRSPRCASTDSALPLGLSRKKVSIRMTPKPSSVVSSSAPRSSPGLATFEVSANSYVSVMPPLNVANLQLQFSQSFNEVASFSGPLIASKYFFTSKNANNLANVQWVYLAVALLGVSMASAFTFSRCQSFPKAIPSDHRFRRSIPLRWSPNHHRLFLPQLHRSERWYRRRSRCSTSLLPSRHIHHHRHSSHVLRFTIRPPRSLPSNVHHPRSPHCELTRDVWSGVLDHGHVL